MPPSSPSTAGRTRRYLDSSLTLPRPPTPLPGSKHTTRGRSSRTSRRLLPTCDRGIDYGVVESRLGSHAQGRWNESGQRIWLSGSTPGCRTGWLDEYGELYFGVSRHRVSAARGSSESPGGGRLRPFF